MPQLFYSPLLFTNRFQINTRIDFSNVADKGKSLGTTLIGARKRVVKIRAFTVDGRGGRTIEATHS